jgi:hypothetical protein
MRVVLSYGMGVDSSVIMHKWLTDPTKRDFDLSDLTVLTAMTGDEFTDTERLVKTHMIPLMKEKGVRFVQVAKGGPTTEHGIALLDDSDSPEDLHIKGKYKLSDELKAAGTVPTFSSGKRLCTHKFKGFVLDLWQNGNVDGDYRHVMGFNADEQKRVDRDSSYGSEFRQSEYPLLEWGMGREECEAYLLEVFGEPWMKSCCTYCPFAGGKKEILDRFGRFPEEAAEAMVIEAMSLAFNPRMTLYKNKSALQLLEDNVAATSKYQAWLASIETWALYRIQRAYVAPGNAARNLTRLKEGTREQMNADLLMIGGDVVHDNWLRAYHQQRTPDTYPTAEDMYVVAPSLVATKPGRGFDKRWEKAIAADWERA